MADASPPSAATATATPAASAARLPGWLAWPAQIACYAAFAAFIGIFSSWPPYSPLGADQALLRLSFTQPGKLLGDCRRRTPEELAKLRPTMRSAEDCPRERSPIEVRIELDGRVVLDESFPPSGLHRDGAASGYRRLPISSGPHELRILFRDDRRAEGFTHERTARVSLEAGQVVLVDFAGDRGGIVIR
jgi:hypothetical protein